LTQACTRCAWGAQTRKVAPEPVRFAPIGVPSEICSSEAGIPSLRSSQIQLPTMRYDAPAGKSLGANEHPFCFSNDCPTRNNHRGKTWRTPILLPNENHQQSQITIPLSHRDMNYLS